MTKGASLLKLTFYLKIYMISRLRTTIQLKLFIIGIVQKFVNFKTLFEESVYKEYIEKDNCFNPQNF